MDADKLAGGLHKRAVGLALRISVASLGGVVGKLHLPYSGCATLSYLLGHGWAIMFISISRCPASQTCCVCTILLDQHKYATCPPSPSDYRRSFPAEPLNNARWKGIRISGT
ncbi:hypothetical protein BDN67DRAFT_975526 [Paxillus ammoniavirescens]|nr:hypothetical protein BDN67DRAFT_975526 [Paxillus ammoniavirescens]